MEMGVGRVNEKPENRKTITIKINGKDRPFQNKDNEDTVERSEPSVFYKDQKSEGKKQDIFREESAAGQEAEFEESFDWILPAPEEIPAKNKEKSMFSFQSSVNKKDKQPLTKFKKEKEGKKKRLPKEVIASIFFAVFFAVILGTSFGFILLNMVNNDQSSTTNGKITASANDSSNTTKGGQAVSITKSAAKPDITTYVLQKGVFSNEERAKSEQQKLTDAGKKSQILPIDKQQYLLVGVVSNLEDAKAWQKQVKDTYAKEMVFSGNEVKNVSKEEKEVIEGSSAIYSAILEMVTSVQFNHSIATEDKNKLEKALSLVEEKKTAKLANEKVKKMAAYLSEGGELTIKLKEKSSENEIAEIHQKLLDYLAVYVSL